MRKKACLALSLVLLSASWSCRPAKTGEGGAASTPEAPDGTPGDLVARWVEMWNAYDLDQVGVLFLTDERVTYFSSEFQGVIQGFDAVLEHHRGFGFVPGGEVRGTRLWVEELTEDVFGNAAVLTGIWYFQRGEPAVATGDFEPQGGPGTGREGGGAAPPPQRGPVSFVCVREGGRWRFAHMNFGNYPEPDEPEEE